MTYIAVQELKRTGDIWKKLAQERELVVTREGKPCAILVGVTPEGVEDALAEIRRALFSSAISRARQITAKRPTSPDAIATVIRHSRRARGSA